MGFGGGGFGFDGGNGCPPDASKGLFTVSVRAALLAVCDEFEKFAEHKTGTLLFKGQVKSVCISKD